MAFDDSNLVIKPNDAATVLECAQLFEYNVNGREWMDLWMKCDPEQSKRMGAHMLGKFRTRQGSDLLHTMGHSDTGVGRILARMVMVRCQKSDPRAFTRFDGKKKEGGHAYEQDPDFVGRADSGPKPLPSLVASYAKGIYDRAAEAKLGRCPKCWELATYHEHGDMYVCAKCGASSPPSEWGR